MKRNQMKSLTFALLFLCAGNASAKGSVFKDDSFYKLTTMVDGKELALTFIIPEDETCKQDSITNCQYTRVELRKFTGDKTQLWRIKDAKISEPNSYEIFSKYTDSDDESNLSGKLQIYNAHNAFLENDKKYKARYNRVKVDISQVSTESIWQITKLPSGKFRVANLKGVASGILKPKEEPYPTTWNELRSLEGYKTKEGVCEVRNGKNSDTVAGQTWDIAEIP
jgi:hypothetical protein